VLELLDSLHRNGRSIVISTHDVELALAWADHVMVLRRGHLIAEGPPDTVLTNDSLLREAGLLQPLVIDAFQQLRSAGLLPPSAPVPRTVNDLTSLLVQHASSRSRSDSPPD
jgi:cobalt/nickel transport system ATP-binding protein